MNMNVSMKIICFVVTSFLLTASAADDKVLFRDVEKLTFTKDKFTTGRRSSPVLQMQCRGSRCAYGPTDVVCENVGWDGKFPTWKCEAQSNYTKLSTIEVQCEGYDSPNDPYILVGSCGLIHTVNFIPDYPPPPPPGLGSLLVIGSISAAIVWVLFSMCSTCALMFDEDDGPGFWGGVAVGAGGTMYARSSSSSWGGGSSWGDTSFTFGGSSCR